VLDRQKRLDEKTCKVRGERPFVIDSLNLNPQRKTFCERQLDEFRFVAKDLLRKTA